MAVATDCNISFAADVLEAVPEPACLYLFESDIFIANARWNCELGNLHRLADFKTYAVDLQSLIVWMQHPEWEGSYPLYLENSGARQVLVSRVPGHDSLFVLVLRDETEVRRVEQMRRDFIANVSHELRTPLTAVRGYLETLMDPAFLTMEHVKEFVPVIFEHTERLHNLMLDLLSLSRLENKSTHIDVSAIPLADELSDAVEFTATLAKMKSITVDLRLPPENLCVLANTEHLERVLVNLLDNAIKYSPAEANVTIWTELRDGYAWTHVEDKGQGIAAEELPRIFERFYRTKGAMGGQARGCGLGLAIVKHIVQQLGGEMGVSSTVGEGSDFYFSLRLPE